MKSIKTISLILAAALFIFGCGKKAEKKAENTTPPETRPVEDVLNPREGKTTIEDKVPEKEPEPEVARQKPEEPEMPRPGVSLTQKDIKINWTDKGRTKMTATAREMIASESNKSMTVKGFKGTMHQDGSGATISADEAFVDAVAKTVTASGNVTLKSTGKVTSIRAPWIKWYSKENRIIGSGGVSITSEMGTIEAPAFEGDTKLNTYTLKDSVQK